MAPLNAEPAAASAAPDPASAAVETPDPASAGPARPRLPEAPGPRSRLVLTAFLVLGVLGALAAATWWWTLRA